MRKYDIILQIASKLRLRNLLEVSTPVTGGTFAQGIESGSFDRCDRLVYRCPPGFDDGLPITFRTSSERSDELLLNLQAAFREPVYDLIFVDSWHTFECSFSDLLSSWVMLRPGGVLVIHDCNPPNLALAAREAPNPYGEWVGVTYQAYVEFLFCGLHSSAFTVDDDYGVGVIFKSGSSLLPLTSSPKFDRHLLQWHLLRDNEPGRFSYFKRHCRELIGLIPSTEFVRLYGQPLLHQISELTTHEWRALQDRAETWFDEKYYLQAHTDVASAVVTGITTSGFAHFLSDGFREGRKFRINGRDGLFVLSVEAMRDRIDE